MVLDVKELFMCLFAIFRSSLIHCLSPFLIFKLIVSFLLEYYGLYILDISSLSNMICKYFLPDFGLSFHSLNGVFYRVKVFNFDKLQLKKFFSFMDCSLLSYLRTHYVTPDHKAILQVLNKFYSFSFVFRSY